MYSVNLQLEASTMKLLLTLKAHDSAPDSLP